MTHDKMKQNVLKYIRRQRSASYAEIERLFKENGFDYQGNLEIYSPANNMVVFWSGWNEEAATIINELKRDNLIHQELAQPLLYLIDGKSLTYPIVRSGRQYKTPHWLPLVFEPGPSPD